MAIILFDNPGRSSLYPFTYTRAVADLFFGIMSIKERWEKLSGQNVFVHTEPYLQSLYATVPTGENLWIDAAIMPEPELVDRILSLDKNDCLCDETGLIAGWAEDWSVLPANRNLVDYADARRLLHPWQMMQWNDAMIRQDFILLTKGKKSQPVPVTVQAIHPENIFIEEGATLQYCTLNASTGPIYIAANTEIMEGTAIRGPFALGKNSVVKMNSRIYGATSLGAFCMAGGEIKNTVMMGYSNKAHDGYLGDSVVGEWCNFGAGSTNSNVKNTAGDVKIWDLAKKEYVVVGQKCGCVMGDYSRVAINSSVNTGSMIGVSCNVFGKGLLPTICENFTWGDGNYEFEKALDAIRNWKKMKQHSLTEAETSVLRYIFAQK